METLKNDTSLKSRLAWQSDFFADAPGLKSALDVFWDIPAVAIHVKDRQHRFVVCNHSFALMAGSMEPEDLIMATDCDFFPEALGDSIYEADRRVLEENLPMLQHPESYLLRKEGLVSKISSRSPVHDQNGEVIGLLTVLQQDNDPNEGDHHDQSIPSELLLLDKLIRSIKKNPDTAFTNELLAREVGVSEKRLYQILGDHFQLTPGNFLLSVRIELACEALISTDLPIVEIAINHGFCDQSWFGTQFRKSTGMSPMKYRKNWQG